MAYLTIDQFKNEVEFLRPEDVDGVEANYSGFVTGKLGRWSAFIDSRLKKRYAVPFALVDGVYPSTIIIWLTDLATQSVLNRRGYNASDPQMVRMQARFDAAHAQIIEAANSETGLFELPTKDVLGDSAVTQAGPFSYSETSPYAWQNLQRCVGRAEDCFGSGTSISVDRP